MDKWKRSKWLSYVKTILNKIGLRELFKDPLVCKKVSKQSCRYVQINGRMQALGIS